MAASDPKFSKPEMDHSKRKNQEETSKEKLESKSFLQVFRQITRDTVYVVASVASFQAETTLQRLVTLAIGTGISMLVLAATLWHPNKAVRYRTFWGLILGLHAFLAGRVWFVTFVPTWWDKESNTVVIAAGAVAALGYVLEVLGSHKILVAEPQTAGRKANGEPVCWLIKNKNHKNVRRCSSVVLLSLFSGTVVGTKYKRPILSAVVAFGCMITLLVNTNPYIAFAAGCCLAHLTMCLWPVAIEVATQSNPGLCLAVAAVTYIAQVLFWVWTVAYNFVPYGEYTREHTDWLVFAVMGCILLMTACYSKLEFSFTVLATKNDSSSVPKFSHYMKVLLLIVLVGQAGMVKRVAKYQPAPRPKTDLKMFTAGVWTFHFGYDNKGWPSMERAAQMINDTGVDVLTLLESDASKAFLGNNDLATWLGEKLNFHIDFGPSTKDHTWGNLILSKYPIVKSIHHLLPSPEGELAPAITASVNISGTIVDFVVTHMGNDRDVLDRRLQAQFLAKELKNSLNPAVFLGYVTSAPGSENYKHLLSEGGLKDIDPSDKARWCEYIMYKKLIRYLRVQNEPNLFS
ncbi:PGAP2-interacting protein-like [Elysia marginata]|uniref:PGAP2-interacting protein-like n=1 Tax=Elysia marginata TaxID=1093978 RepID=A0AAV4EI64_9GAST|nr:PGAP2-interacting protein-like [Elysia marginata]